MGNKTNNISINDIAKELEITNALNERVKQMIRENKTSYDYLKISKATNKDKKFTITTRSHLNRKINSKELIVDCALQLLTRNNYNKIKQENLSLYHSDCVQKLVDIPNGIDCDVLEIQSMFINEWMRNISTKQEHAIQKKFPFEVTGNNVSSILHESVQLTNPFADNEPLPLKRSSIKRVIPFMKEEYIHKQLEISKNEINNNQSVYDCNKTQGKYPVISSSKKISAEKVDNDQQTVNSLLHMLDKNEENKKEQKALASFHLTNTPDFKVSNQMPLRRTNTNKTTNQHNNTNTSIALNKITEEKQNDHESISRKVNIKPVISINKKSKEPLQSLMKQPKENKTQHKLKDKNKKKKKNQIRIKLDIRDLDSSNEEERVKNDCSLLGATGKMEGVKVMKKNECDDISLKRRKISYDEGKKAFHKDQIDFSSSLPRDAEDLNKGNHEIVTTNKISTRSSRNKFFHRSISLFSFNSKKILEGYNSENNEIVSKLKLPKFKLNLDPIKQSNQDYIEILRNLREENKFLFEVTKEELDLNEKIKSFNYKHANND